jgi:hypothetical protein
MHMVHRSNHQRAVCSRRTLYQTGEEMRENHNFNMCRDAWKANDVCIAFTDFHMHLLFLILIGILDELARSPPT